jgi:glycosyltransferase involved in cell wall biosynthesis
MKTPSGAGASERLPARGGRGDGRVVSVVIPTLGRPTIEETRKALAAQTRPPDEVIVVLDSERRGEVWARNEGIRRSRGDVIASTDDDCVPPPDWLERLLLAIDRHDAAGAGGTFRETDPLLAGKRGRRRFPSEECVDGPEGWVGNTGNVAYLRAWLEDLERRDGWVFDPSFESGCDVHLAWRLRRNGARLVFVPNEVTHLRRVTPSQYFSNQCYRGTGIGRLHLAQRRSGGNVMPVQRSLLWPQDGGRPKWARAAWRKLLGPFDAGGFHTLRDFAVYWIGEKCEAAAFARVLASERLSRALARLRGRP